MLGKAAVTMWWDIAPQVRAEWEEWHTVEHMPERLAIPGFLRGSRWVALSGEPSFFVVYEAQDVETITSGAYVARLNDPTPWSRRMMPHHRNMARSLCEVVEGWGGGLPHVLATIRLPAAARPPLPKQRGLTAAHRLEARAMPAATAEQKIRGADATVPAVILIAGYDVAAVESAAKQCGGQVGLYRPAYCLTPGEVG